jgi:hypothetical protein
MNGFSMKMKTWDETTGGVISRIPQALHDSDLILGWSSVPDLIFEKDWDAFQTTAREGLPRSCQ